MHFIATTIIAFAKFLSIVVYTFIIGDYQEQSTKKPASRTHEGAKSSPTAHTPGQSQRRHETRALCPRLIAQPSREISLWVELFGRPSERRVQLARLYVLLQLLLPRSTSLEEHDFRARDWVDEGGNAGPERGEEHRGISDEHVTKAFRVMVLKYAQGGFGDSHGREFSVRVHEDGVRQF